MIVKSTDEVSRSSFLAEGLHVVVSDQVSIHCIAYNANHLITSDEGDIFELRNVVADHGS